MSAPHHRIRWSYHYQVSNMTAGPLPSGREIRRSAVRDPLRAVRPRWVRERGPVHRAQIEGEVDPPRRRVPSPRRSWIFEPSGSRWKCSIRGSVLESTRMSCSEGGGAVVGQLAVAVGGRGRGRKDRGDQDRLGHELLARQSGAGHRNAPGRAGRPAGHHSSPARPSAGLGVRAEIRWKETGTFHWPR